MISVVPQGSAYVVERLGRYKCTLAPGIHLLAPFVDRVAFRFSLAPKDEQLSDVCITLDNVTVSVKSTVSWQIADPERAAYASANASEFVMGLVRTTARQWIAERAWKDVRETTRELQIAVLRSTESTAANAGLKIAAFNVRQIERT